MKINKNFTIESAAEQLKKELSPDTSVTVREDNVRNTKKWLDIDKKAFIGVRVSFQPQGPHLVIYTPNLILRMLLGEAVGGIFYNSARNEFKNEIKNLLISKFYKQ